MANATGMLKIKLIKSTHTFKKDQRDTVRALGLRRLNKIREIKDTPSVRGMLFKVKHLVIVL
jgi:large subunit ribosomal protein L30